MTGPVVNPTSKPVFQGDFCSSRHPTDPDVYCRRQKKHPDEHSAFVFSIEEPESWPTP